MLNIYCVLKTGGVYDVSYVIRLKEALNQHMPCAFTFTCLTDDPIVSKVCRVIPLKHNWPKWWAKIELFRPDLLDVISIYFDLDTVIVKDLDKLVELTQYPPGFFMLRGFNPAIKNNPASGIMLGNFRKYKVVYERFKQAPFYNIERTKQEAEKYKGRGQQGDQGWIGKVLGWDSIRRFQDYLPELYICGKRHTRKGDVVPEQTHIVAWTGNPRLHQMNNFLSNIWRSYA